MRKKRPQRHRGAAIVELAICLPVLVFLVWGTIQLAGSIFMKQTLTSAAHEGALVGMRQNSSETEIIDRVNLILEARGVTGCTVDVTANGTNFSDLEPGDLFQIEVQKTSPHQFIDLTNVNVVVATQRQ